MKMNQFILKVFCVAALLAGFSSTSFAAEPHAFATIVKPGAKGSTVKELQGRLKYAGIYKSDITGYYGSITKSAVIRFQKKYGLKADGIAGPKTWVKLRKVSTKYKASSVAISSIPKSSNGFSSAEIRLMAKTVYAEANLEKFEGKVAVANVILNRLRSAKFPNTISGVIYQKNQFTSTKSKSFKNGVYNDACLKAVKEAIAGWNVVDGALFFYDPKKSRNLGYMNSLPLVKWIGTHKFCKPKK